MKTIVTHMGPDLDACTSSWLVKRFMPGWKDAEHAFVAAGSTLDKMEPDSNPDIIHVDTGFGKFDHHQTDAYTSASKIVFEYLRDNNHINPKLLDALERMIHFVNDIDHFAEIYFPEPTNDRYEFMLPQFIEAYKSVFNDDQKTIESVFHSLDAILQVFRNKVRAEKELEKGYIFKSKWGKSLALETKNEEATKIALKQGYDMVIRKDPEKGFVRIKTRPVRELDLTPLHSALEKADPEAFWFLHASKNMLLNGSSKNPNAKASKLTLTQVLEIVKRIEN
jgi:hypothetical protein